MGMTASKKCFQYKCTMLKCGVELFQPLQHLGRDPHKSSYLGMVFGTQPSVWWLSSSRNTKTLKDIKFQGQHMHSKTKFLRGGTGTPDWTTLMLHVFQCITRCHPAVGTTVCESNHWLISFYWGATKCLSVKFVEKDKMPSRIQKQHSTGGFLIPFLLQL